MSDWFSTLATGNELPVHAASELESRGFVVLPGMVAPEGMERLTAAYTGAVASATGDDIRVGSTSIVVRHSTTSTYFRRCSRHPGKSSVDRSS
jgi:hypothetical protein